MWKLLTVPPCMVLVLASFLTPAFAQETPVQNASERGINSKQTAPAFDPPQIVIAAAIDDDDNLLLVNFRTIFIGFTGESYNNRSLSKTTLKDVQIFTVNGERVSVDAARKQLADKDTPILCSSWAASLPDFYASMFAPNTLHFIFPKESPAWKKIQEPGRPVR